MFVLKVIALTILMIAMLTLIFACLYGGRDRHVLGLVKWDAIGDIIRKGFSNCLLGSRRSTWRISDYLRKNCGLCPKTPERRAKQSFIVAANVADSALRSGAFDFEG